MLLKKYMKKQLVNTQKKLLHKPAIEQFKRNCMSVKLMKKSLNIMQNTQMPTRCFFIIKKGMMVNGKI